MSTLTEWFLCTEKDGYQLKLPKLAILGWHCLAWALSQPDCQILKNLKTIWAIKLIFCFHWSYKNMLFWVMPQNTLAQSVCRIFYFCFYLLIIIPGIHCYIVFVGSAICKLVLKLTMVIPRRVIQLESCIN